MRTREGTESAEIDRFLAELEAVKREAAELVAGLSDTQLNWSPGGARWSVAQCIDHLTRTVRLYPDGIRSMIAESRRRAAAGERPYRESVLVRLLIRSLEPPYRMKAKTITDAEPRPQLSREQLLRDFMAAHDELGALAREARDVDLRGGRMRSPFAKFMRFTLGQIFFVNTVHARRHLWQARQVMAAPQFPAA